MEGSEEAWAHQWARVQARSQEEAGALAQVRARVQVEAEAQARAQAWAQARAEAEILELAFRFAADVEGRLHELYPDATPPIEDIVVYTEWHLRGCYHLREVQEHAVHRIVETTSTSRDPRRLPRAPGGHMPTRRLNENMDGTVGGEATVVL